MSTDLPEGALSRAGAAAIAVLRFAIDVVRTYVLYIAIVFVGTGAGVLSVPFCIAVAKPSGIRIGKLRLRAF